jgi:TolB-like protein/Tfp pilus assembly protein PilF
VVGFPVAMFLAWTFDFTAKGIQRTSVTSRRGTASIVASMVLLIAGTTGLFFLIKPSLQVREVSRQSAPPVAPDSLAVLPFANASGNTDDTYLVEGLSDELRDQLARISGLRIAARSSSIAATEQGLDAFSASQKLGVVNLLEGNVRRQGNVLRVSAQLIEGSSGLAIWSATYERGPGELLSVQQAIAEAVIAEVLPDAEGVVVEPATRDPTANELLLLARHYEQQVRERLEVDQETMLKAVQLFRQATEVDPDSALAHSRLAGALLYIGDLEASAAPIFRALSLSPNSSEVQSTLGEYYWARGMTKEGGAAWALAVELNPNDPEALVNYGFWLWSRIQKEGAKEQYRRALELDRLNLERYAQLGSFLAIESHDGEARQLVSKAEELFDGAAAYRVFASLHSYLGDVDVAIAWALRARELEPDNPWHIAKLAEFYADIGDFQTALKLDPSGIGVLFKMRRFEDAIALAEVAMIDQPDDMQLRATLAYSHVAIGQYESAIHVLNDTGLPDSVLAGWRTIEEMDGYRALTNALYGTGQTELARKLAQFREDWGHTDNFDWWVNILAACDCYILGETARAHEYLEKAQKGVHLPWDPLMKDMTCFKAYSDDPVYQATIRHYEDRRAMLRERLPATLAEFGVSL